MEVELDEQPDIDIDATRSACGCNNKTSLDNVVYPALRQVRQEADSVSLSVDGSDVGLFPRSAKISRSTSVHTETAETCDSQRSESDEATWTVGSTFVDAETGRDPDELAAVLKTGYDAPHCDVVLKGHTVQLRGATSSIQITETFRRSGRTLPGCWAANTDVIHAFPEATPVRQARIATLNALNDCYTVGATDQRSIRPILVGPASETISERRVREWYRQSVPDSISVLPSLVIPHDGTGWLFGATVVAGVKSNKPMNLRHITPGDAVLLHRPLGALALYTFGLETEDTDLRESAARAMCRDHFDVAETLSEFLPDDSESFDPSQHLKLVTDISGEGIREIQNRLSQIGLGLRLSALPLLEPAAIDRAQDRWLLPDVTVETNGPLAFVGDQSVISAVKGRLDRRQIGNPQQVGTIRNTAGGVTTSVDVSRYIEELAV